MKKKYLIKQKLMGLGLLLMSVLLMIIGKAEATIITIPLALLFIFEKRIILSSYYEKRSKRAD